MGFNESLLSVGRAPGQGDVQIRQVILSGGSIAFTSAAAFTDVYGIQFTMAKSGGAATMWDSGGTVFGGGFTANDTVKFIITGLE